MIRNGGVFFVAAKTFTFVVEGIKHAGTQFDDSNRG